MYAVSPSITVIIIFFGREINTISCSLCKSRRFIWMCVTAVDLDLQQSPYATPLLTPAPLPIGAVRHKILTRSMRFLHRPPTGKHSRGEERRGEGTI